jgi:hypothetical protein
MDPGKEMKRQESKEFVLEQIDGPVCLREPVVKAGIFCLELSNFWFLKSRKRALITKNISFKDNAGSAI